ncbi:hypothetical protein DL239_02565, partial [Sedimentitalea sp. CY04]|nr:hypothetical protein [Sedimentitalea sp. CY04]
STQKALIQLLQNHVPEFVQQQCPTTTNSIIQQHDKDLNGPLTPPQRLRLTLIIQRQGRQSCARNWRTIGKSLTAERQRLIRGRNQKQTHDP